MRVRYANVRTDEMQQGYDIERDWDGFTTKYDAAM